MRRYPTRDEIIEQEDDRRWLKEVTKETQPMSDTLPASAHRVNSSGNCSISGCPCRGWSAQETTTAKKSDNDYQREQFPVGTIVEAIVLIGRGPMSDPFPVGTRGKVTSHCDDGRAWVFFDGEGHTFHEIEKFVRVVQPVKEVSEHEPTGKKKQRVSRKMADYGQPVNAGRPPVNEHQPAARGGGERVRVELINGVEGQCVSVNDYRICGPKPWGGGSIAKSWTTDKNDVLRAFLTPDQKHAWLADELEVVSVNQHHSLVAERERLREAIEVAIHNLNAGNDPKFLADYLRLALDQNRRSE